MGDWYPYAKALHVTAMVIWLAGMLATPPLLAGMRDQPAARRALRRWYSGLTAPAMIVTVGLGIVLAQSAGWFAAGWLQVKLLLVLGLAALHGALSGQLRRLAADPEREPSRWILRVHWPVGFMLFAIAILAIVKPSP